MSNMIFCQREQNLFPQDEFVKNENGDLYQPPIHRYPSEHWATTGLAINPTNLPDVENYDKAKGVVKMKESETDEDHNSIPSLPDVVNPWDS